MAASIEDGVEKPAAVDSIANETADRSVAERRLPLVAIPRGSPGVPPRTRGAPRTGGTFDLPARHATPIHRHAHRTATIDGDTDGDRRAEAAHDQAAGGWLLAARCFGIRDPGAGRRSSDSQLGAGRWQRETGNGKLAGRREARHLKSIRTPGIEQHRRSAPAFADQRR